jgi:hypothetical protein
MNTLERRISEQLRAYGEGLDMTTQDIDRLEHELEAKQEQRRATRKVGAARIWQGAVAACAVTGVVLGALALREDPAPPPAGPPPITLAELEGIWRLADLPPGATFPEDAQWLWRFTADGRLIQSERPDILTAPIPADATTVRPAPGGFIAGDPGDPCEITWAGAISAEGRLTMREAAWTAACTDPGSSEVWTLKRVSPVSVEGAATGATTRLQVRDPQPVTDTVTLQGTWILAGTGKLLTIDPSGNYAVQDLGFTDEPETGLVVARPDGTVTFTPEGNAGCRADYSRISSDNVSLKTTIGKDSCGRLAGIADTWHRIN